MSSDPTAESPGLIGGCFKPRFCFCTHFVFTFKVIVRGETLVQDRLVRRKTSNMSWIEEAKGVLEMEVEGVLEEDRSPTHW